MQLNDPRHGSDGDKLEGIQRSKVPVPLGRAGPAEERDESSSMCVAWLKDSAGCGGVHDNWRLGGTPAVQTS